MERIKILKIFKRQFLQFPNSVNPNSCQCCGGIYRRGYFCLIQIPEIKKESSANNFVTSRGQRGPKRATGTYCSEEKANQEAANEGEEDSDANELPETSFQVLSIILHKYQDFMLLV